MVTFDIKQLVPRFIWEDRNGHALSIALGKGLEIMCGTIQNAVDCVFDVSTMPEWRLDEMAWEPGILYDYSAPVEVKRKWIENAMSLYSTYGTKGAVEEYLKAAFDTVSLEEWWEYGADPYHFRVTVTGEWSQANDDWAKKSIESVKNVRSVLDTIIFNSGGATIPLNIAAAVCGIEIEDEAQML